METHKLILFPTVRFRLVLLTVDPVKCDIFWRWEHFLFVHLQLKVEILLEKRTLFSWAPIRMWVAVVPWRRRWNAFRRKRHFGLQSISVSPRLSLILFISTVTHWPLKHKTTSESKQSRQSSVGHSQNLNFTVSRTSIWYFSFSSFLPKPDIFLTSAAVYYSFITCNTVSKTLLY